MKILFAQITRFLLTHIHTFSLYIGACLALYCYIIYILKTDRLLYPAFLTPSVFVPNIFNNTISNNVVKNFIRWSTDVNTKNVSPMSVCLLLEFKIALFFVNS